MDAALNTVNRDDPNQKSTSIVTLPCWFLFSVDPFCHAE